MARFKGNETVGPGLYFNLRHLSFKSMEHEGRLPGTENEVYHGVPWMVLVFAGPILGLVYVIFLPFIGVAAVLALLGENRPVRPKKPEASRDRAPSAEF